MFCVRYTGDELDCAVSAPPTVQLGEWTRRGIAVTEDWDCFDTSKSEVHRNDPNSASRCPHMNSLGIYSVPSRFLLPIRIELAELRHNVLDLRAKLNPVACGRKA